MKAAAPSRAPTTPPPPPPARHWLARRAAAAALAALAAAPLPLAAAPGGDGTSTLLPPAPPVELPALRAYAPPRPATTTLPNGLRVFSLADSSSPTLRGVLLMRGGQRAAPASALGVATLAARTQREGGSAAHPGPALDAALDALAADIETGASLEATAVSFECLAEDGAAVLGLVGELVASPALPPDALALAQSQIVDALRHRDDDPAAVPGREGARRVYGRGSVFARSPTVDQVAAVTVADARAYLQTWQRPDASILVLVGGVDAARAAALAAGALGSWAPAPGQPAAPPAIPTTPLAPEADWRGRSFLYDRPGAPQATVVLMSPGVSLADPDAPALDLLAATLNGFGGRLFDGLRSKDGLAYSVSAGWDTGRVDHVGLFAAGGATAKPAAFLVGLRQALADAVARPPAGPELEAARGRALRALVFRDAAPDAVAARAAAYELLGVPADYLMTYRTALENVTEANVAAAAARWLAPGRALAVVAADARAVRGELAAAGLQFEPLVVDPVEKAKQQPA